MPPLQSLGVPQNDQAIITAAEVSGRPTILWRGEVDNSALEGHALREAFNSLNIDTIPPETALLQE